jgi:hypothetical protein
MAVDLLQDPAAVAEIKFAFFYCMFSFWSSGLLVLVCTLSEGVEAFGSVLHSPLFLSGAAVYELGKVFLAKVLSGHGASLRLSTGGEGGAGPEPVRPVRGPLLRRLWLRGHRLLRALAPLLHLARGLLLLGAVWLAALYITGGQQSTGAFLTLIIL